MKQFKSSFGQKMYYIIFKHAKIMSYPLLMSLTLFLPKRDIRLYPEKNNRGILQIYKIHK